MTAIDTHQIVSWGHDELRLALRIAADGTTRLGLGAPDGPAWDGALPLVEVAATGHGRHWSSHRLVDTSLGSRLRHRAHHVSRDGQWHLLAVELHDPDTGLVAEVVYRSPDGVPALRAEVVLRNEGAAALPLEAVTSLTLGGSTGVDPDTAEVWWADNDWLAEFRWQHRPLRAAVPQLSGRQVRYGYGKGSFALAGQGTWSSCGHLPMGALTDRASGRALVWQIEHNGGGWRWECSERHDTAYLALSGPTDGDHGWRHPLAPGEEFRAVPVSVAFGAGLDEAFGALTRHRRASRRPHPDHRQLPVIFNDYMNCLMGDPSTAKLLPLVDAAAEAGAEFFVIDAGWYGSADWWDAVGEWQPSPSRFPGPRGIHEVLDRIRERGMVPGLWLEPEVVGVRSPVARALPEEAFFRRDGVRVVEAARYQLDLRHPAARAHLDAVVDRLVGEWGVGYLKLDHNIDAGSGTSGHPGEVPAAGALGHHRAHLAWLDGVLDRHPQLVLENCASGGMRADQALLSRMQLLSTSDQQNLLHYAPIAAAAPTAVTPEQGAVWAYPQPGDTPDEVAFTLVSALLGRIHLSGQLAGLDPAARALVHQAVAVHRELRADLPGALPVWPLGLPAWDDPWVALALRTPGTTYLTAWRRPGADPTTTLRLPHLLDTPAVATPLFPANTRATTTWHPGTAELVLTLPAAPSAVLLRLS